MKIMVDGSGGVLLPQAKKTYKAMYRYMKDYLNAAGVHNLIYVYSPNGPIESETEYNERYPGDDYVDILAFDYYDDIDASSTYNDSFLTVYAIFFNSKNFLHFMEFTHKKRVQRTLFIFLFLIVQSLHLFLLPLQ